MIKVEASPVESFLSLPPSDKYSSLFTPNTPSNNIHPLDVVTPQSVHDENQTPQPSAFSEASENSLSPQVEENCCKKPAKKRKSWGQVLPEPKTNLPPRKRAKTEDEKEQRRVERVLRNRRAAQSSRERKRLEVEALEIRNRELEEMLVNVQKANLILVEELNRFRRVSGVTPRAPSLNSLRDTRLALSQELFSSQDGHNTSTDNAVELVDQLIKSTPTPTVNPASLSPEMTPVPDEPETEPQSNETESGELNSVTSADLTQRPAEMLFDLQCHKSAKMTMPFTNSQTQISSLLTWALQLKLMELSASAILSVCQRPLMQIAMSSKASFSLLPSPQILTTIIWLVTLPPASRLSHTSTSSTSRNSSTTKQTTSSQTLWQRVTTSSRAMASSPGSPTLRFKSLKNILSCSPNLARPLMDATMESLRLVSEGRDDRGMDTGSESGSTSDSVSELSQCLRGIDLPSREVLITLLWVLKVEDRKVRRCNDVYLKKIENGSKHQSMSLNKKTFVLKVSGLKRSRSEDASGNGHKKFRMN